MKPLPFIHTFEIIESKNFKFEISYEEKHTKDKKSIGQGKIIKTMESSILTNELNQNGKNIKKSIF